ncbi:hypothetical protein [Microbacterium sp.]|uniref:hypothetical protein n=1 Tax=Microbacterium sp. TaxID=51671 RepID=UPI00261CA461|nr:hypothetical protein [Microbacterium sp.]
MNAPLAARVLAASLRHIDTSANDAVVGGSVGSRRVRAALAEVAATVPLGVVLTRSEAAAAARWLHQHGELSDEAVAA